jgi:UPF0755 protein
MKAFNKAMMMFVIMVIAAALLVGGVVYYGATRWKSPEAREVIIRSGSSLRGIASQLYDEKVIGTPKLFEILARARGVSRGLRAGAYEFPAGSTLSEVLRKLASGDVKEYAFTVIEGWTIDDIAAALVGQPYLAGPSVPEQLARLAKDGGFVASVGVEDAPSLEGYLFPDTYLVEKPIEASTLLRQLVGQFHKVWAGLDDIAKARTPLSKAEIVTLASIVEKETGAEGERPLVAAVFLNRLKKGMPLQSDPTIIYGLKGFDGNIRKTDITNPHKYNTYVHPGLPPGPIANPGKASLEAVLTPARVDYLYFVAKGDGTHHFSTTLSEHLAAVRTYQLRKP